MKVKLTPYGKAFEAYKKAEVTAVPCNASVSDACIANSRGQNRHLGAACAALAKVEIDGEPLCYKHASMITLREAIRRTS